MENINNDFLSSLSPEFKNESLRKNFIKSAVKKFPIYQDMPENAIINSMRESYLADDNTFLQKNELKTLLQIYGVKQAIDENLADTIKRGLPIIEARLKEDEDAIIYYLARSDIKKVSKIIEKSISEPYLLKLKEDNKPPKNIKHLSALFLIVSPLIYKGINRVQSFVDYHFNKMAELQDKKNMEKIKEIKKELNNDKPKTGSVTNSTK